jgi:hypothetical protein
MPRIPRISGRARKEAGDAPQAAESTPAEAAADAPQVPAETPETTESAESAEPAATEVPQGPAAESPESVAETAPEVAAAEAPVATTELPVLGAETPVSSAETSVMDAAPQALTGAPAAAEGAEAPATTEPAEPEQGSFVDRGRMRRRLRYLRRTRELAFRDLGGLLFDLHRFGRSREDLVQGKLARLTAIDTELRALETALEDRQEVTVLREPGLAACPRCGALHGSDANYCPMCALPVRPGAGLPVAAPSPAPPEAPASG